MEDQVPSSTPPQIPGQITPDMLEGMKQQAREMAVAQYMAQQQRPQGVQPSQPMPPLEPQRVVYVRRNLTVAELIVVFVLATGLVAGIQTGWRFASENLPRIEIQVK
jgi:hypothetical protein